MQLGTRRITTTVGLSSLGRGECVLHAIHVSGLMPSGTTMSTPPLRRVATSPSENPQATCKFLLCPTPT